MALNDVIHYNSQQEIILNDFIQHNLLLLHEPNDVIRYDPEQAIVVNEAIKHPN